MLEGYIPRVTPKVRGEKKKRGYREGGGGKKGGKGGKTASVLGRKLCTYRISLALLGMKEGGGEEKKRWPWKGKKKRKKEREEIGSGWGRSFTARLNPSFVKKRGKGKRGNHQEGEGGKGRRGGEPSIFSSFFLVTVIA